jgi:hypothetical protein
MIIYKIVENSIFYFIIKWLMIIQKERYIKLIVI